MIRPEMTLKREALEAYLSGGVKESSVVNQVVNGRNAMPAFGGRLEDQEIENVASYVIDQAVGGKWDTGGHVVDNRHACNQSHGAEVSPACILPAATHNKQHRRQYQK